MRKILFVLLALVGFSVGSLSADTFEKYPSQYGDVTLSAAAPLFFAQNGYKNAPVTYTAASLVPKLVYIEKLTAFGQNNTLAYSVTLVSTDVTYSAGTNELDIQRIIVPAGTTGNTPVVYDFTNYGQSKGILCKNWPAVRVDGGTNTANVKIQYVVAPKNKVQSGP